MTEQPPQGPSDTKDTPAGLGIGNIPPKVRKYGVIAALGLVAVGVMMSQHGISCSSADARETVGNIAKENHSLLGAIRYQGDGSSIPASITCEQDATCGKALQELNSAKAAALEMSAQCRAIPAEDVSSDDCPGLSETTRSYHAESYDGTWGKTIEDDGLPPRDTGRKKFMDQRGEPILSRWRTAEAALDAAKEDFERKETQRQTSAWTEAVKKVQYQLDNVIMTATDKDTGSVSCKADLVAEVPEWGKATRPITYTVEKTSDGDLYATVWGL